MKRSNLETIVLVLGITIIVAALFLMFVQNSTPQSIFITNIIFSVGFLIYILYSMMTTNTFNREIRGLNNQVSSLKVELEKRRKIISEKESRIQALENDNDRLQSQIKEYDKNIESLRSEINKLQSASKGNDA